MHLGEQMELRSSKSQIPLSNNNPSLPEKKDVGLVSVFLCLAQLKWKSLLGGQGKL